MQPGDDLCTCARTLIGHDLDAVPVVSEDQHGLGLITANDIAWAVAGAPVDSQVL